MAPGFTLIFWYRPLFMLELVVAETIFAYKLRRRNFFWLRAILSTTVLFGISFLFPVPVSNPWYNSFMFIFFFGCTFFALKICLKESWGNVLFCALAGYTIQHLSYLTYSVLYDLISIGEIVNWIAPNNPYTGQVSKEGLFTIIQAIIYIFAYFNIYFVAYNNLSYRIKKNENLEIQNNVFVVIALAVILSDVVFNQISVFYTSSNTVASYLIYLSSMLICVLSLTLQFSSLRKKQIELEMETEKMMYNERLSQYEMSKENISLINKKVHDLKHQIHKIGKSEFIDQNELKEIEKAVSIYDSIAKTGNESLDVILSEKSLLCQECHITLSMIADGKLLDFMEPRDIFSFFGNAMDNAIDALQKVEEDKRVITILIRKTNSFVTVHIENYFDGIIKYEGDRIVTIKDKEQGYHGYGILSMKSIVERYNGILSFDVKGNSFALNATFNK